VIADYLTLCLISIGGIVAVSSNLMGCASKSHCFVASRSSARIGLSHWPEKALVTAAIYDPSAELADMCHCTVHGPDKLDFRRTSERDHVHPCAHMCSHALGTWQSSSEAAKIRN
jgi:hypothetical protein